MPSLRDYFLASIHFFFSFLSPFPFLVSAHLHLIPTCPTLQPISLMAFLPPILPPTQDPAPTQPTSLPGCFSGFLHFLLCLFSCIGALPFNLSSCTSDCPASLPCCLPVYILYINCPPTQLTPLYSPPLTYLPTHLKNLTSPFSYFPFVQFSFTFISHPLSNQLSLSITPIYYTIFSFFLLLLNYLLAS